jgi:hypothetical protein
MLGREGTRLHQPVHAELSAAATKRTCALSPLPHGKRGGNEPDHPVSQCGEVRNDGAHGRFVVHEQAARIDRLGHVAIDWHRWDGELVECGKGLAVIPACQGDQHAVDAAPLEEANVLRIDCWIRVPSSARACCRRRLEASSRHRARSPRVAHWRCPAKQIPLMKWPHAGSSAQGSRAHSQVGPQHQERAAAWSGWSDSTRDADDIATPAS